MRSVLSTYQSTTWYIIVNILFQKNLLFSFCYNERYQVQEFIYMHKILVILMYFLLCSYSVANEITFLQVDFAPYYILSGKDKGQGRDEEVINLLSQSLPEYTFKLAFIPSSRALYELQHNKATTCMLSLYKTAERQLNFSFSTEFSTIGLAPTIAMHNDVANAIISNNIRSISLKDLVFKHQLVLGKSTERSYGLNVDAIIKRIPQDNIIVRAGKDSLNSLTYMLIKKRIDIILGYPGEHLYLQEKYKESDKLIQFQISEAPQTVLGFIGCNKSVESKRFLSLADAALKSIKATSQYRALMLRWVPERLQPNLVNALDKS